MSTNTVEAAEKAAVAWEAKAKAKAAWGKAASWESEAAAKAKAAAAAWAEAKAAKADACAAWAAALAAEMQATATWRASVSRDEGGISMERKNIQKAVRQRVKDIMGQRRLISEERMINLLRFVDAMGLWYDPVREHETTPAQWVERCKDVTCVSLIMVVGLEGRCGLTLRYDEPGILDPGQHALLTICPPAVRDHDNGRYMRQHAERVLFLR